MADAAQGDAELFVPEAQAELASIDMPDGGETPRARPFKLEDFAGATQAAKQALVDLGQDVELDLQVEFGRAWLHLDDVARLRQGSLVRLDQRTTDPVDILVHGRLVARGEILVLNDNFCVRVAELVPHWNATAQ